MTRVSVQTESLPYAAELHGGRVRLLVAGRLAGTGAQGSMWPRLRELNMPVLAMAGERDTKFTAIARQIAEAEVDYVPALKDNHPTLRGDVRLWLDTEAAKGALPAR